MSDLQICRSLSSRRSHAVSRPETHPSRAGLRSPGEPATALDDREFDHGPEPDHGAAESQVLPLVVSGPTGYTPQQIQSAYGVNQITFSGGKVVGNGAGQTIAIVTAYNDPNISSDLATFDKQYGLSAPPPSPSTTWAATTTDPGWAWRRSFDVEWAQRRGRAQSGASEPSQARLVIAAV